MPYSDDVVRVSVVEVIVSDAEVPIPTSEIKFLKEALGSFVPWPTHLVKPMLPEVITSLMDSNIIEFVKWLVT